MILSQKITIIITIWILIAMILTGDGNLEVFFILVFIGILIIRELTDIFTTSDLKSRMNLFIYMFLVVFVFVVANKIISILNG
jgi:hypothetical protein